ncbi:MAG: methyltransferase [Sphingomonadaceae bacterium]
MRTLVPALAALMLASPAVADHHGSKASQHAAHAAALEKALAHPSRAEDRARDQYRHPAETLMAFGVEPDMKVGEYAPGGGWYSRVLGNYLNANGKLVGLFFDPTKGPFRDQQAIRDSAAKFPADAAGWTGKSAGSFAGYTLDAVPDGEAGTFDRILVVRMMHNMMRWNMADSEIAAMRDLLKDDGMVGIVQHRAPADASYAESNGSRGYLREADVISFMELHGFRLVGMSSANANPKDSADWAQGVWELPPRLRTEREELKAIGESDRMTLLFAKRD